jgi:hypothetical protein
MKAPLLVVLLLTVPATRFAQCVDNGAVHGRFAVKTRGAPSPLPNPAPIDVADVLHWLVPHVASFNDSALIGDEERQIVHLRAFVRLFKCEADGDYHLEVADSAKANARRVIIEAAESPPQIRQRLELLLGGPPAKTGRPFNGTDVVPIEVWGWRFLDLDHQSALVDHKTGKRRTMAQLKKGHGHGSARVGTLWEVHPILRVEAWTP